MTDKSTWVYLLHCADGKYYVGSYRGEDIDTRVAAHNNKQYENAWTSTRLHVTLVWCDELPQHEGISSASVTLLGVAIQPLFQLPHPEEPPFGGVSKDEEAMCCELNSRMK